MWLSVWLALWASGCGFDKEGRLSLEGDIDSGASIIDAAVREPVRININGRTYTGMDYEGEWLADPGKGGVCGPNEYLSPSNIGGTVDDALFQGVVYGNPVTCAVGSIPAGRYTVRLYFGEVTFGGNCPFPGGVGSRVFDVVLEGTKVLSNLDVYAEGGCIASAYGMPVIKSFDLDITDGALDISLPASKNQGFLSAIEIVPI